MTKNFGLDYDDHAQKPKPSRLLPWIPDVILPLILVGVAFAIGHFGWPF